MMKNPLTGSPVRCHCEWFFIVPSVNHLTTYSQGGSSLLYKTQIYSETVIYQSKSSPTLSICTFSPFCFFYGNWFQARRSGHGGFKLGASSPLPAPTCGSPTGFWEKVLKNTSVSLQTSHAFVTWTHESDFCLWFCIIRTSKTLGSSTFFTLLYKLHCIV